MTVELGEPGVIGVPGMVTVPRLPGVVGGTEHRVPGTGQRTGTGLTGSRCDRGMFRVHWSVDRRLLNRPFRREPGVIIGVARRRSFHPAF